MLVFKKFLIHFTVYEQILNSPTEFWNCNEQSTSSTLFGTDRKMSTLPSNKATIHMQCLCSCWKFLTFKKSCR